jgi:5,10-methylenetetrahydromethanopterin reductase
VGATSAEGGITVAPAASGMSLGACAAGLRDGDVAGWIRRVQNAEELGYGVLGMSDSFVSLATAAGQTSRTRLATMCTNPVTRHPSVMASDISVINAISGGRAVLVIGRGFSQVVSLGLPPATTKLLGDYVRTLRQLLRHEDAEWQGRALVRVPVDSEGGGSGAPVPVYVAGYGPVTLKLAGAVADGVVIASAATAESMQTAIETVRLGAMEAGRDPREVAIWAMVRAAVRDRHSEAVDDVKALLAGGVLNLPKNDPHTSADILSRIEELRKRYRFDQHATWRGSNGNLLDELGLTDFAADRLAVCGTPDECRAKLKGLADLGVECIHFPVIGRDGDENLRRFATEVWPEGVLK